MPYEPTQLINYHFKNLDMFIIPCEVYYLSKLEPHLQQ